MFRGFSLILTFHINIKIMTIIRIEVSDDKLTLTTKNMNYYNIHHLTKASTNNHMIISQRGKMEDVSIIDYHNCDI